MSNHVNNHTNGTTQVDEEEIGKQATRLAYGAVVPMAMRSAVQLGAIDVIYDKGSGVFLSPSEIAQRLPCKPSNPKAPVLLDRLLRLLASFSILKCHTENGKRTYATGPVCKYFARDEANGSIGPFFLFIHEKYLLDSWYHVNDAILEGGVPFNRCHGMTPNEYYASNPEISKTFNHEAMTSHTIFIVKKLLDSYYGFENAKVVVDVAGGVGTAVSLITKKYPQIKGINFDLPHVVADAPAFPGVEHVGGDMFVSVPKGDAVFMKYVFHLLSDEECVTLMKNCYKSLPSHGKVTLLGTVLAEEPENDLSSHAVPELDPIVMIRWHGGRERTLKEFNDIAHSAGFLGCNLVCKVFDCWVMEFDRP